MNAVMSVGEYFFGFLLGCVTLCVAFLGSLFFAKDFGRYLKLRNM